MARVSGNILGFNRGKIGELRYWVVKGQQFNGEMPGPKPKGWSPTKGQSDQMEIFTFLTKAAMSAAKFTEITFKSVMDKTPYLNTISAFVKLNYDSINRRYFEKTGIVTFQNKLLKVSKGILSVPVVRDSSFLDGILTVRYDYYPQLSGKQSADDKIFVVIYNETTNSFWLWTKDPQPTRAEGEISEISFVMPTFLRESTIDVYLFAQSADDKNVSDSVLILHAQT